MKPKGVKNKSKNKQNKPIKNNSKNKRKKEKTTKEKLFKNYSKTKIISIISIILIILIINFFITTQIKIKLSEEMNIQLKPNSKSLSINYDEIPEINFTINIENPISCELNCTYEFKDVSFNKSLKKESFSENEKILTFKPELKIRGEGQKIYELFLTCNNIQTTFCSTNKNDYLKNSLITINYNIPPNEQKIKLSIEKKLPKLINEINKNNNLFERYKEISRLIKNPLNRTTKNTIEKNNALKDNLIMEWEKFHYFELETKLNNLNEEEQKNIEKDIINKTNKIITEINIINNKIIFLKNISNTTKINQLIEYSNNKTIKEINKTINLINKAITIINNENNSWIKIKKEFLKTTNKIKINFESIELITKTNKEKEIQNINNSINKYEKYFLKTYNTSLINSLNETKLNCELIDKINKEIILKNNKAKNIFNNTYTNITFIIQKNISNEFIKSIEENRTINLSKYENVSNINFSNKSNEEIKKIIILPKINKTICKSNNKTFENLNLTIKKITKEKITLPKNKTINRFDLVDNKPICCFNNECSICCTENNCQNKYPLIFVHGHAFSKSAPVEDSLNSFSKIQKKLEENNYVNAGVIDINSNNFIPKNDWGRINESINLRISYYYISYIDLGTYKIQTQKDESIENYALRLKENIELIKFRTGKKKVDIIAHSMGGLVVREYVALFGEDDINKIIFLGTPNKGIEGKVKKLCSITGASKECSEMSENSIFLKKLNRPENNFEKIKGYTIRASGCDMDGKDGDGVVITKNVPLDFTTNYEIKGNCTDILQSNLHSNFTNPELYPQTFELIKKILEN